MKLFSIGVGYIGLPLSCLFAESGVNTIGISRSQKKVAMINNGRLPFHEPGLEKLLQTVLKLNKFHASTAFEEEVQNADAILICVPTPLAENNRMDAAALKSAATRLGVNLQKGQLVIVESTVSPGTTERMIKLILESESNLKAGKDFFLAYCPERAIPGNTLHEMRFNSRVIGGIDKKSTKKAVDLYRNFVKGKIVSTNAKMAEIVKLVENSSRDVQIAFANELALICEKLGVNVFDVISYANLHPRVSLLQPGAGVGGHCLPIDPWFLIEKYPEAKIIPSARTVNNRMPEHVANLAVSSIKKRRDITESRIVLFGLTYKPDVDDIRETPSKFIVEYLRQFEVDIIGFDPYISSCGFVKVSETALEAVRDSDCIIIVVNHSEFRKYDWVEICKNMRTPILLDCSNFFSEYPQGFNYFGIGKPVIS